MNILKKIIIVSSILIIVPSIACIGDDNLPVNELDDYMQYSSFEVSSSNMEPNTYSKNIIVIDRKTLTQ